MAQLHRQYNDEQVRMLLHGYCQGVLTRAEVQEMLRIGKTRFFAMRSFRGVGNGYLVR